MRVGPAPASWVPRASGRPKAEQGRPKGLLRVTEGRCALSSSDRQHSSGRKSKQQLSGGKVWFSALLD